MPPSFCQMGSHGFSLAILTGFVISPTILFNATGVLRHPRQLVGPMIMLLAALSGHWMGKLYPLYL